MVKKKMKKEGNNNNLCAILSYLLIGIIWYFLDKDMKKDSFVRFHVKQGLVLLLFGIVWSIFLNILFGISMFGFFYPLFWSMRILSYVPLVFAILGIINAANNKKKELPIIGKFAEKLNF